jgi:hypothetical protein
VESSDRRLVTHYDGWRRHTSVFVRRATSIGVTALTVCVVTFGLWLWRHGRTEQGTTAELEVVPAHRDGLPFLDAHRVVGVREITKAQLLTLMSKNRSLSETEKAQVDRGCPGFTCLYQGLGLTRWSESAKGTRAYLRLEDALNRSCPDGHENFIFLKQAWWTSGKPPTPDPRTGEVPLSSVTRAKPGWYTFNYAVYFPTTKTYV